MQLELVREAIKLILEDEELIERHPDLTPVHVSSLEEFVDWKTEMKERIDRRALSEINSYIEYIVNTQRLAKAAKEIIDILDTKVDVHIEPILNEIHLMDVSFKVAHELARKLHLKFEKDYRKTSPTVTYKTFLNNGIELKLYVGELPRCKIVPKKITVTETIYEVVCT